VAHHQQAAHTHFRSEFKNSNPDAFFDLDLFLLILIGIEGVETVVVVDLFVPYLASVVQSQCL
jgi:hypothetical protein